MLLLAIGVPYNLVKILSRRWQVEQNSTKIQNRNGAMENLAQQKPRTQSAKCKVFEIPLKNFAIVGIDSNLATQTYPLNGKIFMGFLILGYGICASLTYLIHDAKTFAEYTILIYACSFVTLLGFILLVIIIKVEKMFDLINACDQLVNTSKCRNIHFSQIFFSFWKMCCFCFRMEIRTVEIHLQWGHSARTKIWQNYIFRNGKNVAALHSADIPLLQLFHVLYHRFWQRSLSIADASVVRMLQMRYLRLHETE